MISISNILEVEAYVSDRDTVLFDLDDTLYSEKEYVRSGFSQVAALFPDIPDAEKLLWNFFQQKMPAIDCFVESKGLAAGVKETCLKVYRAHIPDIHLYPGVREMLIRLKQHHRLGMITDGRPDGQRAKIRALGLEPFFNQIIITDELGGAECRKPNPLAFRMMAEKLGVKTSSMCYVGDNPRKDIAAAEAAGVTPILFQNSDGLYS